MQLFFSIIPLLLFNQIVTSVSSIDCDLFEYGPFCSLDPMSNIIQTIPSLENESRRQHSNLQLLHVHPVQRRSITFQLFPPSRLPDRLILLRRRSVLLDLHPRPRLSSHLGRLLLRSRWDDLSRLVRYRARGECLHQRGMPTTVHR